MSELVLLAILILMTTLLPVLIPATISAFHALAKLSRLRAHSRAARNHIGYVVEPVPASA